MADGWQEIASAQFVESGTVADLKMRSGRVIRAAWTNRGRITAWWPLAGNRRRPIGLYEPREWRVINQVHAIGIPVGRASE